MIITIKATTAVILAVAIMAPGNIDGEIFLLLYSQILNAAKVFIFFYPPQSKARMEKCGVFLLAKECFFCSLLHIPVICHFIHTQFHFMVVVVRGWLVDDDDDDGGATVGSYCG